MMDGSSRRSYCSVVYANPQLDMKQRLWSDLQQIAASMTEPWLVVGDFNDITGPGDKKRGAPICMARCNLFVERFNKCNLIDLGYMGSHFTWVGSKLQHFDRLYERLDRAFGNDLWNIEHPNCFVRTLPQVKFSDHHPILIDVNVHATHRGVNRPFRFEATWLTHKDYDTFIKKKWRTDCTLQEALKWFQEDISDWNREVFGNIKKRKRRILARLGGIQKNLAFYLSPFLKRLEHTLQEELDEALYQEDVLWFQKARTQWIEQGDRNTKYYHIKATMRRRRNKILMLCNDEGAWIDDLTDLKKHVVGYFKRLFAEETGGQDFFQTSLTYPIMETALTTNMTKIFSNDEIDNAIHSMGAFKAPDIDGFSPIFYQSQWGVVGLSLIDFCKKAFNGSIDWKEANKTLITLIPKVENPEFITQF